MNGGIIRSMMTEDMCPGKRVIPRVKMMVERGAEAIVFASCITKGNQIRYPYPNTNNMGDSIIKAVGPDIKIIEWTH